MTEVAPNGKLLLSCPMTSEDAFCTQNDPQPLTVTSDSFQPPFCGWCCGCNTFILQNNHNLLINEAFITNFLMGSSIRKTSARGMVKRLTGIGGNSHKLYRPFLQGHKLPDLPAICFELPSRQHCCGYHLPVDNKTVCVWFLLDFIFCSQGALQMLAGNSWSSATG